MRPGGEQPDAIINIVDATNLERNLYLTMQLLELERPVVLALNFMDEVEKKGDTIDCGRLSALLGVPVIPISARDGTNIAELVQEAHRQMHTGLTVEPDDLYDDFTHAEIKVALQVGGVDDVDDGVGLFADDEAPGHQLLLGVGGEGVDARQVHHGKAHVPQLRLPLLLLHRDAGPVAREHLPRRLRPLRHGLRRSQGLAGHAPGPPARAGPSPPSVPGVRPMSMSRRFTAPRWLPTCRITQLSPMGSLSRVFLPVFVSIEGPLFLIFAESPSAALLRARVSGNYSAGIL